MVHLVYDARRELPITSACTNCLCLCKFMKTSGEKGAARKTCTHGETLLCFSRLFSKKCFSPPRRLPGKHAHSPRRPPHRVVPPSASPVQIGVPWCEPPPRSPVPTQHGSFPKTALIGGTRWRRWVDSKRGRFLRQRCKLHRLGEVVCLRLLARSCLPWLEHRCSVVVCPRLFRLGWTRLKRRLREVIRERASLSFAGRRVAEGNNLIGPLELREAELYPETVRRRKPQRPGVELPRGGPSRAPRGPALCLLPVSEVVSLQH